MNLLFLFRASQLVRAHFYLCWQNRLAADIGKLLSLSERTVQNHRHRIRKKLSLKPASQNHPNPLVSLSPNCPSGKGFLNER